MRFCTACVEYVNTRDDGRSENIQALSKHDIPIWPYFHWPPIVACFVYNNQKSNLYTALIRQNTREHNYYLARTEHDCTATTCIFNWNTYATGHIQGTVVFPSSTKKKMPRSTANSGVTVYLTLTGNHNSLLDLLTCPPFSDALGNKFFSPFGGDKPQWRVESVDSVVQSVSSHRSKTHIVQVSVQRATPSQRHHDA